jgi:hypothetical protein
MNGPHAHEGWAVSDDGKPKIFRNRAIENLSDFFGHG